MTDLAAAMTALRDRKGWRLADGLIRAAARHEGGSLESLDKAFRGRGVVQTREVLGQLIQLRTEAEQQLQLTQPTVPPVAQQPPAPSTTDQPGEEPDRRPDWQGPPSWYRSPPEQEDSPAPASPPHLKLVRDPEPAGPPQWYREMHDREAAVPDEPPARPAAEHSPSRSEPSRSEQSRSLPPSYHRRDEPPAEPIRGSGQPGGTWSASPGGPAGPPTAGPPPTGPGAGPGTGRPLVDDDLPDLAVLSPDWDPFAESDAGLRALVDSTGRTILRWDEHVAPPGSTTVYLVCGSAHAVPESPAVTDRIVATVDRQVILSDARHRFFAVFAYPVRTPAELSSALAVRHAIGRVVAEVGDLVVDPAEHGVLLSWTRPDGIERVRVMRSLPGRPLPKGPDPERQVAFTGDAFRDPDVEPGSTYTYRVYTESLRLGVQDGSIESSPGLERTVTVPGRPDPVTGLSAVIRPRERRVGVSASWNRPARGTVTLYVAPGRPHAETVVDRPIAAEQWALQLSLLGERIREPVVAAEHRDTIPWMPLDTHVDGGRHSQWTVSAVTEFSGTRIIGAQAPLQYVGDIDELLIEERVDWQLIRSTWPTGATFIGVWFVPPGSRSHGAPPRLVNREEFDRFGGVGCTLGPEPVDVLLQGATRYGGDYIRGGQFRIHYPGRWTVRWELAPTGRFGSGRALQLAVDRPGWPNLTYMLIADSAGFPLRNDGPTIQTLHRGELPHNALVPRQWVTVEPDVRIPKDAYVRLLAWTSSGARPIVIDPVGPSKPPPGPEPVPAMRCPRCLRPTGLETQHFRCQGSCSTEVDEPMTKLLHPGSADPADAVVDRPVFEVPRLSRQERRGAVLEPPIGSAHCPACGGTSHQEVCPHCHSELPPNWWSYEVLGVVMVGARQSGKTTYLSGLVGHLENKVLPAIGGFLHPIDPESEAKLEDLRKMVRTGELFQSTVSSAVNAQLLRPMIASIGQAASGRNRALSLFDVAGEDMTKAETVRPYAPALASADLIVILIDPLQLNGVREWLDGVVELPGKGAPPRTVVTNVVNEIRRFLGIPTGPLPTRVAVAFAKFDGIQAVANAPHSPLNRLIGPGNALWRDPYVTQNGLYFEADGRRVHDEVRALLLAMNEAALVKEVESSFREFRYFALSALGHGPRGLQLTDAGASPQRVGDPIRWLLWSRGWGT